MHIIIVGAGRTGKHVIKAAIADKHDVFVIEENSERAEWVASRFDCIVIKANATSPEVLKEAKANEADAIVVTTSDDAINMMVILQARELGTKRLVSSVNNEGYLPVFEQLDIDVVESPFRLNGRYLYRAIQQPNVKEFLDLGDGIEIVELQVASGSLIENKLIKELNKQRMLPSGSRIMVIKRESQLIVPEGDTRILEGDVVAVLSSKETVHEVDRLFAAKGAIAK
ncbi:MAG: TrkA family potassium uptake protein [Flavobacteriales bacterium]|nr:TrkA family potassium uptake protein [Flavobacteriales bacterium]